MKSLILNNDNESIKRVLVFASNIDNYSKEEMVCEELLKIEGIYDVNVDLEDWENILRVECASEALLKDVKNKVSSLGFECHELLS
ncbi:hypothetical protein OOZ15_04160 [Galbibacter sp. EGI 63066]|uniref:hypothetical protein n=1 Tax=Galbibacter sp. EGI 63066 TaxID=2993559 RepID=UPI002249511E|nr:hypothetical protein [Galbibacter sp. EGI 63066]MCX2679126.1 hypothetical protein [Galbibacter sp. EGI 63066]